MPEVTDALRKACDSCRRPMSAAAVRCPSCSAFQARVGSERARVADEQPGYREPARLPIPEPEPELLHPPRRKAVARAPTVSESVEGPEDEPGIISGLVLPHPRTAGLARVVEIALTVIALPLIAFSLLGLVWLQLRISRLGSVRGQPRTFRTIGALIGAVVMMIVLCVKLRMPEASASAVVGISSLALLARGAIRIAAKRPRPAFDLLR